MPVRDIKSITIEVIDHDRQRYDTVGDYFFDEAGHLFILVSKMPDNRHELLVIVHELIEVMLTENAEISESIISSFDKDFEVKRADGNTDEPGDDSRAPYKKQHCLATGIERIMAFTLGVDWKEYERACNEL